LPAPPGADLILRGGTVVDGTGAAPRRADVAVRGRRILAVGDLAHLATGRTIDVTGLVVAPGFIDLHSHADLIVLAGRETQEKLLQAKLLQGVTSLVVGNCGLGVAPASARAAPILGAVNGWMTPVGAAAGAWSVGKYLARLAAGGCAVNVATLVPHGPLRISAMGPVAGPPSPAQLERMRRALRAALAQGGFGLSAGLIYPPGMYSDTDELVALAGVVAERDRLFTLHVRGSSETLLHATDELIEIARRSRVRAHHSHLEAVGEEFWPRVREVLEREDRARAAGLRLSHDVFPYTRAATMMTAIFPPWSLEGGVPGLLERLASAPTRERIGRELERQVPEWPPWRPGGWPHNLVGAVGWDGIRVASVEGGATEDLAGRSLAEIATAEGRAPYEVVVDLMLAHHGQVGQLVDEVSGRGEPSQPLLSILEHPAAAVVSDAEDYGRGLPHPAHAGAFARALRIARERGLPLERMVGRMTGHPASLLGLVDRGRIAPGAFADLAVFDPGRVADHATWDEPRRPATGVQWVLLNGNVVVEDGRYVGGLHGTVLRAAP
jgi:N-acyl-D-aspartate/D-glutamate deacylase